jgi:hypothetical protein
VVEILIERLKAAVAEQRKLVVRAPIAIDIRRGGTFLAAWISPDIRWISPDISWISPDISWISPDIGLVGVVPSSRLVISADICLFRGGVAGWISIGIPVAGGIAIGRSLIRWSCHPPTIGERRCRGSRETCPFCAGLVRDQPLS